MVAGVALITGGARRIGRAIALGLAGEGWAVAVHHHRSHEAASRLASEIEAHGGRATVLTADLADEAQSAALVPEAAAALGPVTALINNASLFVPDDLPSVTPENFDAHMRINLRAPLLLMQGFARALPAGAEGAIVNIIDHRVLKLNPLCMSYTLSKAALWTLTRTAAQALAPRIRVNAVGPGPVLPNTYQDEALFRKEAAALPLGRGPSPDAVVDAVMFLLDATSVTGQMIAVDGGQHLAWDTDDLRAGRGE